MRRIQENIFVFLVSISVAAASNDTQTSHVNHSEGPISRDVVRSKRVTIVDHPYHISLEVDGVHKCGGAILNATFIITAAHCTYGFKDNAMKVRAGSSIMEEGGQLINVSRRYEHPQYNIAMHANDISILELEEALVFNKNVSSISLPSQKQHVGTTAHVTGWRSTNEDKLTHLHTATLRIIEHENCIEFYNRLYSTQSMLCVGNEYVEDECEGDFGFLLVRNNVLLGIISFRMRCAASERLAVYTNVVHFRKFIRDHFSPNPNDSKAPRSLLKNMSVNVSASTTSSAHRYHQTSAMILPSLLLICLSAGNK